MRTRFDSTKNWISGNNEVFKIEDMKTMHIINTLNMFKTKPSNILSILISDVESGRCANTIWTPENEEDLRQSRKNITSMTKDDLVNYACNSPVARGLIEQLELRGVNLKNVMDILNE